MLIFLFFSCSAMSSPRMQPSDHISMPSSYLVCMRMISGARYQRLTTWEVMSCPLLAFISEKEGSLRPERASPKSQSLML